MRSEATYQHSGERLALEYLDRLIGDGIDAAELTAAAEASPELADYYGRFLPNPVFLGSDDCALLARQLEDIHDLMLSLPERRFDGSLSRYGQMLGLPEPQLVLAERAPREKPPLVARADLYRTESGFALLELNFGSSLGGFQCGEINRAMLSHPSLANFMAEKRLTWVDTAERLIRTALALHAERSSSAPLVALVDWPDTFPIYRSRIEVMARLCHRAGVEAFACHLGELQGGARGLTYHGRTVDIVYRFFLLEYVHSAADLELLEPLLRAEENGMVTVLASTAVDLYGYKASLALLSEMVHSPDLDGGERESVTSLVPWTRGLRSLIDDPAGEPIEAIRFALAWQSELILKPVSLHSGTGIVTGWTVSAEEWRQRVEHSLNGPYILQQRIRPAPDPVLGKQTIDSVYSNWGVYLTPPPTPGSGSYSGCYIRASNDPEIGVINYLNCTVAGSGLVGP